MLTDEQIIRTLAEFMGYRDVAFCQCCNCWTGRVRGPQGGGGPVHAPQLLYLTSYDALAPVCKKAWETVWVSAFGNAFRWWEIPPKALAEVLATAILEAKEQS